MAAAEEPRPLARREMTEELKRLLACLGRLEEDRRRMVLLAYYSGWSREQLAGKFDTPANTLKTWLRRSLIEIRAVPRGHDIDEDTDALAAEYVLGTLDADERAQADVLLASIRLSRHGARVGAPARRAQRAGRAGRAGRADLGAHQGQDRGRAGLPASSSISRAGRGQRRRHDRNRSRAGAERTEPTPIDTVGRGARRDRARRDDADRAPSRRSATRAARADEPVKDLARSLPPRRSRASRPCWRRRRNLVARDGDAAAGRTPRPPPPPKPTARRARGDGLDAQKPEAAIGESRTPTGAGPTSGRGCPQSTGRAGAPRRAAVPAWRTVAVFMTLVVACSAA